MIGSHQHIYAVELKHYERDVFDKAAADNGWELYPRPEGNPTEWTFPVTVMGDPVIAHVTRREGGFPKIHGPVYDHPAEYKVARRMVLSAMDKAEYALYGNRACPNEIKGQRIASMKRRGEWGKQNDRNQNDDAS